MATGNFSWDASARTLTTDDFTLGFWAANGVGFALGQGTDSYQKAHFSGDGLHGEARMEGGNTLLKCLTQVGLEFYRTDTGELWFGVGIDGKVRVGSTTAVTGSLSDVVRKLELFAPDGTSLGFVPIYDEIN